MRGTDGLIRCEWAGGDTLMVDYHDREWGVPVHDDRGLFEFLMLEGAQAGLSWRTILRKREAFRRAFADFSIEAVASFSDAVLDRQMENAAIIRHRGKLEAIRNNARVVLTLQQAFGSFDAYIWRFIGGVPRMNTCARASEIPSMTVESTLMSRDLAGRGMRFVGPTICYAFMQAVGMVNDHTIDCFRYAEIMRSS